MKFARAIPSAVAAALLLFGFYALSIAPHEMHYMRHRYVPVESLPYSFFQILRLVACGTGCFVASNLRERKGWLWTMVIIAILFNPILPVRLDRRTWQAIDLATGVIFLASILILWRPANVAQPSTR